MESIDRTYPFQGVKPVHATVISLVVFLPFFALGWAIWHAWGNGFGWLQLALLLGGWGIGGMGITVGYHRLVSHGAFKARAPVRLVALIAGASTLQGSPAVWGATHQRHHARSDQDGDPHSPLVGLVHSHLGWLFKGRLVHQGPAVDRLLQDPVIRFVHHTHLVWGIAGLIVPGFITLALGHGFVSGFLWGGAVRLLLGHHVTWSVNSIGHLWGTRPHETTDRSRNNGLLALLSFGEGWHNNHHAEPRSAYIGHRWYQVDPGRYAISILAKLRLVKDIHRPKGRKSDVSASPAA